MASGTDLTFVVQTGDREVRATISPVTLRTLAGRTHVTVSELLDIYRFELEEAVRRKVGSTTAMTVRLDARDL